MIKASLMTATLAAALTTTGCVDGDPLDHEPIKSNPTDSTLTAPLPTPSALGALMSEQLASLGDVSAHTRALGYELEHPLSAVPFGEVTVESCQQVNETLWTACDAASQAGLTEYCSTQATFFWAHSIPRCAARVELYPLGDDTPLHPVYAFDFAGASVNDPPDECGNGIVDEGEDCDDGNHDLWDGCDSDCRTEPFNGCEAIIEQYYEQAEIAFIDKDTWNGPRSHMMVNTGQAMRDMNEATCNAAISMATDVCNELTYQMPFVGWCQGAGEYHSDSAGPACSVRLNVWFQSLDEDFGVFTTSLPGLLSFTIR